MHEENKVFEVISSQDEKQDRDLPSILVLEF